MRLDKKSLAGANNTEILVKSLVRLKQGVDSSMLRTHLIQPKGL